MGAEVKENMRFAPSQIRSVRKKLGGSIDNARKGRSEIMPARTSRKASEPPRLTWDQLAGRLASIFEAYGCSPPVARSIAENCASAERDGATSHGLYRLPGYLANLENGWVDGRASPSIDEAAPAFFRVDAHGGFAQPAAELVRPLLIAGARKHGIAIAALRNSCHFGALALDVEPFAEEGLLAISLINCERAVVPHGAISAVLGTNPIAFAAPRAEAAPLIFDFATASAASGEVAMARMKGIDVPPGTGVDAEGIPTTDPARIIDGGALLPFGGHKGSSIALMIEILCAALVDCRFSFEVSPAGRTGVRIPRTGQTIIVIDPEAGGARQADRALARRVDRLVAELRDAGQDRIPGDRRTAARIQAHARGIAISPVQLATLDELASP